jgi:hypothetical protein
VQARSLVAALAAALAVTSPGLGAGRGSHVYRIPTAGAGVSLPSSWKPVDAEHLLRSAELQRLEQENPELGDLIAAVSDPNSPVKFFAFDPDIRRQFATNLNVVVSPLPTTVTFAFFANAITAEVRALRVVSQLRTQRVTLAAGPALRLTYRIRVTANGRSFQTATLQYAFLRGGNESVVFTYTTLPQLQAHYAATFGASASSIRFG